MQKESNQNRLLSSMFSVRNIGKTFLLNDIDSLFEFDRLLGNGCCRVVGTNTWFVVRRYKKTNTGPVIEFGDRVGVKTDKQTRFWYHALKDPEDKEKVIRGELPMRPAVKKRFVDNNILLFLNEYPEDAKFSYFYWSDKHLPRAKQKLQYICDLRLVRFGTSQFSFSFSNDKKSKELREIKSAIVRTRKGQAGFRKTMLSHYGNNCAISGHAIEEVLQAAHIIPYSISSDHGVHNGLVLRMDIHRLFDLGLITVRHDTLTVEVARSLKRTPYWELSGLSVEHNDPKEFVASRDALKWHNEYYGFLAFNERQN